MRWVESFHIKHHLWNGKLWAKQNFAFVVFWCFLLSFESSMARHSKQIKFRCRVSLKFPFSSLVYIKRYSFGSYQDFYVFLLRNCLRILSRGNVLSFASLRFANSFDYRSHRVRSAGAERETLSHVCRNR